mmetsp:Transcript_128014/g.410178  ORF Transcript_128014/g.410178 Transcript_128014/m.410178 type:complete len:202 (-) Transcript_128014:576-1181(-)
MALPNSWLQASVPSNFLRKISNCSTDSTRATSKSWTRAWTSRRRPSKLSRSRRSVRALYCSSFASVSVRRDLKRSSWDSTRSESSLDSPCKESNDRSKSWTFDSMEVTERLPAATRLNSFSAMLLCVYGLIVMAIVLSRSAAQSSTSVSRLCSCKMLWFVSSADATRSSIRPSKRKSLWLYFLIESSLVALCTRIVDATCW